MCAVYLCMAEGKLSLAMDEWNGRDFYLCAGEGDRRRWPDMARHGFVSAGGGRWYSRTLRLLAPGHRLFAHVPQVGYVGVGIVTEPVVPVAASGLLELNDLEAPAMDRGTRDPDLSEYVVRVRWMRAVAREDAFWIPGLFANQNSVARLRHRWTLERLCEAFEVPLEE